MNILVLNAGSGSQKCSLFQVNAELPDEPMEPIWKASIESTFPHQVADELLLEVEHHGQKDKEQILSPTISRTERIEKLVADLWTRRPAILPGPESIDIVGHRVVHGGAVFHEATRLNQDVEAAIKRLSAFAPLHNPSNLEGIQIMRHLLGDNVPQVAVFDTSFHQTLPEAAAVYPGPYDWLQKGIRRYGFHGTSFRWAAARAAYLLNRKDDPALRLIICHLGGGCSLAATVGGQSVDTTMGFTPLDGIAMCTRSGALDPGILIYLMRENPDIDGLETMLNKRSGLKGLSGLAGDTRIILPQMKRGNARARLAADVFIHRFRAGIGQMLPALQGPPDAIVFTDAIGEDEPHIRAQACEPFKFLGLEMDSAKNSENLSDADISLPTSRIKILIIKGREDWEIARQCHLLAGDQ
jgi:acetate kinase